MAPRSPNRITYFARTDFRTRPTPFGIKRPDRLSHMYLVGKTGTGKTTLLETLLTQDIAYGEGLALLDPHGDLVERVAANIPEHRKDDLIYFNPADAKQPWGYNPFANVPPVKRPLAASGFIEVLHKQWDNRSWGPHIEHILRNLILALLEQPRATFPDMLKLLHDKDFRKSVTANVENRHVREFWLREFERYPYRYRLEMIAPVVTKISAYLSNPVLSRVLVAPGRPLRFRSIMDEGKVLLVNLSLGKLGNDVSSLLGGLLVTAFALAAFSRADVAEENRRDFYLYIDEFQNFTTLTLAAMLSELRKFHVGMVVSNQFLDQLEEDIRLSVLGNVGTLVAFRLGPKDAGFLAREFEPEFETVDLARLPNHSIYLKLLIDGAPSKPFSAVTVPPWEVGPRTSLVPANLPDPL